MSLGSESVRLLRRALFLKPHEPWAMLAAYFDESGTHAGSKILVFAGLVSTVSDWEALSDEWGKVLGERGISAFHTSECAHRVGIFEGWSQQECDAIYRKLVGITTAHVKWRTWSALIMPDYMLFFADENKNTAHYLAYSFCATSCVPLISEIAIEFAQPIPYVFDRGGLGAKFALRAFEQYTGPDSPIQSVAFGSRDLLIPLQVADLHAYEVYKYFADQLDESANRPVRRSFREIMRIPEAGGGGHLVTWDKFKARADAIRSGDNSMDIGWELDHLTNGYLVRIVKNEQDGS